MKNAFCIALALTACAHRQSGGGLVSPLPKQGPREFSAPDLTQRTTTMLEVDLVRPQFDVAHGAAMDASYDLPCAESAENALTDALSALLPGSRVLASAQPRERESSAAACVASIQQSEAMQLRPPERPYVFVTAAVRLARSSRGSSCADGRKPAPEDAALIAGLVDVSGKVAACVVLEKLELPVDPESARALAHTIAGKLGFSARR